MKDMKKMSKAEMAMHMKMDPAMKKSLPKKKSMLKKTGKKK